MMSTCHRTNDVISADESITFSSMHLKPELLRAFDEFGYFKPSPIQLQAIPRGKLGMDLIAQSKSGTGKTLTFVSIIFERLTFSSNQDLSPRAMIIAPTREIAVQIVEFMRRIGKYFEWMTCDHFIGGVPLSLDKKKLNLGGCQIVVGTPGRIMQLIKNQSLPTFNLKIIVFDEADTLFCAKNQSFFLDIRSLLSAKTPKNKQILAFSATFIEQETVNEIASFMRNAQILMIANDRPSLIGVDQFFVFDEHNDKMSALIKILQNIPFNQCVVFINDKKRTKQICDFLIDCGFPSANIGGDQPQSERLRAIQKLKAFKIRVLVSSDLTSRGIDCDRINLVINLDLPFNAETYLHRVGRTGRFGTFGLSVSIVANKKEKNSLNAFIATLKTKINKLPKDIKTIANKKYLKHSLPLNKECEKKQFEMFEKKRKNKTKKNAMPPPPPQRPTIVNYSFNDLLQKQALKAAQSFHAIYG